MGLNLSEGKFKWVTVTVCILGLVGISYRIYRSLATQHPPAPSDVSHDASNPSSRWASA